MTITLQAVNELIASLESAGELSIREEKFLKLAKAYQKMAAENVGLNKFIAESCFVQAGEVPSWHQAIDHAPETPATSDFLAEVRAQGVELCADSLLSNDDIGVDGEYQLMREFAAKLREGADK
ncbi:hypothetical protein [Klebsiella indica]|uniref:hypothetical protein n=1 Tax=Klebsiella indica TaxID=2582917 RepID=UPI0031B70922